MSSWLNTKSFVASLAKNAMAEAQRTLDRALEIPDDEEGSDPNISSQHGTANQQQKGLDSDSNGDNQPSLKMVNSATWGSFSGSFFEASELQSGPRDETSSTKREGKCDKSAI